MRTRLNDVIQRKERRRRQTAGALSVVLLLGAWVYGWWIGWHFEVGHVLGVATGALGYWMVRDA